MQTKALSQLVKKATKGDNSVDTKEINDEFEKLVKNIKEENTQRAKDGKYWNDENNQRKKDKKYWDSSKSAKEVELVMLSGLVKAGQSMAAVFVDNVKTYDQLNAAGINVINGMDGTRDGFDSLRELTSITGVRFTELAASMTKYSSAVNSFGVGKFAKTIGMASSNLTQFGFSSKESAELLGSMLSIQQSTTDVNHKSQAEAAKDLQHFGESIYRLSQATGISREAIIANAEAISKSTDANLLAGQVGTEAAGDMTTFLASFKDQNVARQFLSLMSAPVKVLDESFMNLQKVGMGGFAQSFTSFTEKLKTLPEDQRDAALKGFVESHRAELESQKQRLALLKQAGVAESGASLDFIVRLTQQSDSIKRLTADERKKQDATNAASKAFQNAIENFKSLLQGLFTPTVGMLNAFTLAMEAVLHPLDTFTKYTGYSTEALGKLADKVGEVFKEFAPWIGLGVIGAGLAAGFKDLLKGFKLLGGLGKRVVGKSAEGLAERAGGKAGGGIGGALGSLGKGLGGLGKGIGEGIGGALKGLADGLAALGKPQVLLGVVSLAGIAAALWIAGKAIQQFIDLKWEDLAKAGVALVGLGLAGAALSLAAPEMLIGAAAITALGASLWVVGKAISAVGNGITTISTGLSALSNTLGTFKGLDTLKSLVATVNELEITKALALAALSVAGVGSMPAAKPTSGVSASTTPKSSTLNSPSAVSTDPNVGGKQAVGKDAQASTSGGAEKPTANSGLDVALGYQSSILQQILESTNNLVSVNKDILKYSRVNS